MSILFSLFNNYVPKCVIFCAILIIIVMIIQSEDLQHKVTGKQNLPKKSFFNVSTDYKVLALTSPMTLGQ